jgi:hypothetical protein
MTKECRFLIIGREVSPVLKNSEPICGSKHRSPQKHEPLLRSCTLATLLFSLPSDDPGISLW